MGRLLKKMKTACSIFAEEGICVVFYKMAYKFHHSRDREQNEERRYQYWVRENEKTPEEVQKLDYEPKITVVVPVYNVSDTMLRACIESVRKQTYKNWELCMADDASTMESVRKCLEIYESDPQIKVIYREKNGHISQCTNTAIHEASGEFIAFMDCDDTLAPNALYEVAKLLNDDKTLDFIYTDEDKLTEDGRHRHQPHFKPDWSPDTMMSLMYTCHLGVYRKTIGDELGWLRTGFEGAQDYDFTLRFTEKTDRIGHIAKILYHWRERQESTAMNPEAKEYVKEATKKAKMEALARREQIGHLEWVDGIYQYRVVYEAAGEPLVSIIIPSKDNFEVYKRCVDTIIEKTTYSHYEIITVDNGSSEENRKKYEAYTKEKGVKYLYQPMEFNFSKMCNDGVKASSGEYVLLLNDDMEILQSDWLGRMAGHAALSHIGAVGAKLLYPNTTVIQHIGVISFDCGPVHSFCKYDDDTIYYFCRNKIEYNYSAVTAACLMVSRKKYDEVGGLDESFKVAYNDVDFCFKLTEKGYYNVARMDVMLYHHESLSRGDDVQDPKKYERLVRERQRLYAAHPQFRMGDRFYNPNLTMQKGDCSINLGNRDGIRLSSLLDSRKCTSIEPKGKLSYSLDSVMADRKYIYISGWCINTESSQNNLKKAKLCFWNGEEEFIYKASKVYRKETGLFAGTDGKYGLCSFIMKAETKDMPAGKYHIVMEKCGAILDTERIVEVER